MADLDDINKNIQLGNLGKLVALQQRREQITQDAEILDELKLFSTNLIILNKPVYGFINSIFYISKFEIIN